MGKTRIISHYYLIETFFLGFFFGTFFFWDFFFRFSDFKSVYEGLNRVTTFSAIG